MTNSFSKIGKVMLNLSWLTAVALLTLFFAGKEADKRNPNRNLATSASNGYSEVILERNAQYHYLADGSINDQPVTFLVDTGASDVAVPAALATTLGLRPGQQSTMYTANGNVTVQLTKIDNLKLGGIEMTNVQASINPGMTGDEVLLGMSFLKHLEFSQKNGQLTLRQPP